jgi:hypothetical protein
MSLGGRQRKDNFLAFNKQRSDFTVKRVHNQWKDDISPGHFQASLTENPSKIKISTLHPHPLSQIFSDLHIGE